MIRKCFLIIVFMGFIISLFTQTGEAATIFKLGHTDPPDSPRHKAAILFADKVKQYTSGKYEVNVYHSETLGNDPKLIELTKLGGVDFCVSGIAIYANQLPELGLLALPYLVETFDQGWHLYDDSEWVKNYFNKLLDKNIRILSVWEAGFRCMTTKKPVNTVADVKGMKLRIAKSEMYVWIWTALGANPTVIALGEVYIGLQQGVIDGQENPIVTIYAQKFYEVAKYVSLTRHIYAPIPLSTNEKMWQKLDKATQEAILRAASEAQKWNRAAVIKEDDELLSEMSKKGATIIKPDIPSFAKASLPVYDKARETYGKDVVDGLMKATEEIKKKYPTK
jgi:tripartite ATP-independent transporter DctP family solute receptor